MASNGLTSFDILIAFVYIVSERGEGIIGNKKFFIKEPVPFCGAEKTDKVTAYFAGDPIPHGMQKGIAVGTSGDGIKKAAIAAFFISSVLLLPWRGIFRHLR